MVECADIIHLKVIKDQYNASTFEKISEVIGEEFCISKESLKISRTPQGKPLIKIDEQNLEFNVSHSDQIFILGMNKDNIKMGIDLEKINKRPINLSIVKRFFSMKEQDAILASKDQSETLLRFWSRKEALVKCLGTGMVFPFASINTINDKVDFMGKTFRLQSIQQKYNEVTYWLTLAIESEKLINVQFSNRD